MPIETPITNGPFGRVANLSHVPFRIFNSSSLTPVLEGGVISTFALTLNEPAGLSENFVLFEKGFGNGYLSVAGEPIYMDDYNPENIKYFLNWIGYACNGSASLNVISMKQTDAQWANLECDSATSQTLLCGTTIGQCGCAMTSAAMVLNYFGVDKDPSGRPTTPETLNNYLSQRPQCDQSGCISYGYKYGGVRWNAIAEYSAAANKAFGTQKIVLTRASAYDPTATRADIEAGNPVILQNTDQTHWFVAKGISGNTFTINDPKFNRTSLADYGNSANLMRTYERTASDFASFEATSKGPTQLLVTDQKGRRTGFDPETNSVVEEIPNSSYYFERPYLSLDTPDETAPAGEGTYTVLINTPEDRNYKVQTIAPVGQEYSFAVYASDHDGETKFDMFEETQPAGGHEYSFNYSAEPGNDTKFALEIPIDIRPLLLKNVIFSRIGVIPVAILATDIFDAFEQTKRDSLKFGKTGTEDSLAGCFPLHLDWNRDKKGDLICLFYAKKTNFTKDDTKGVLTGITKEGLAITGSDSIKVF